MAAEGYLPHATLIRGRGWSPASDLAEAPLTEPGMNRQPHPAQPNPR
jgi:hypothetical protein